MKDTMNPLGTVIAKVIDENGIVKQTVTHNIITVQGDAYIADQLALVPVRQKINATNCFITVGTGYTGLDNKTQTWVNTQTGSTQAVDVTFPKLSGAWGEVGQNQLSFQFTFAAGTLNASGINEACIVSTSTQGLTTTCLAYAQISSLNVTISDQLVITWQILFNGS